MDAASLDRLGALLRGTRVLSLAVAAEGEPLVGLLPFALSPRGDALIVHASELARHSRGLLEGAPFDALIHQPETPEQDPLQVPRLTLRGRVRPLEASGPDQDEARRAYLERLPAAEPILGMGGFRLYRLEVEGGRLVAGFARAMDVEPEDLAQLTGA